MGSPETGLGLRSAPALSPLLWNGVNLLFVPGDGLSDALRELCRSLPLEVRAPRAAPHPFGARGGMPIAPEEWPDGLPSLEESVGHQLALSGELSALAASRGARLADASLWCALLGPNGWLNAAPTEAARSFGVGERIFLEALGAAQRAAEPPGLFARDAAECLLLQLDSLGGRDCDAGLLLTDGREALESGGDALNAFRQARGWPSERLERAMAALRRLDPAPGRAFSIAPPALPELDFYLAHGEPGGERLRCRLARENLPHLSLASEDIQTTLTRREWGRAKALLLRLGLRYRTLLRIGVFLAERQAAYLTGASGEGAPLLPLGLRDIAGATGLHISTVSRCLANTWARSPARTLRLSSLLSRSLRGLPYPALDALLRGASEVGESDAALSRRTGIPRRTIAYHRARLGIAPAGVKRARGTCGSRTEPDIGQRPWALPTPARGPCPPDPLS